MKTTLKEFLTQNLDKIKQINITIPVNAGTFEPRITHTVNSFSFSTSRYADLWCFAEKAKNEIPNAEIIRFGVARNSSLIFGAELEIEYDGFGSYQTLTVDKTTFTFYNLTPCY